MGDFDKMLAELEANRPVQSPSLEHSPGPWRAASAMAEFIKINDRNGATVGFAGYSGGLRKERAGDTALICAAPEMLAMLKRWKSSDTITEDMVDALLAKAEGRQP